MSPRLAAWLVLSLSAAPVIAAEDKIDCENALTTHEMNICAERAYEAADARLNACH